MTLVAAQQRTSEITARLQQLAGPGRSGGATVSGATFASALSRATSSQPVGAPSAPASGGSATGEAVVAMARSQLGTPYVWGGEKPGGFDCSGLIQWSYAQLGVDLPRVSRDQAKAGREVSAAEAQPGDLVFFDRPGIDHIGMYAGNGQWVVAPKTGDVVKMQDVDLSKATTIRRVLPDSGTGAAPAAAPVGGWAARLPPAGRAYAGALAQAGAATGVDPKLLAAVAWSESGFNPKAVSPAGATGLMQLMPRTAAGLGVDPKDPVQALKGGGTYLAEQLGKFGRTDLALAAYNAGPGAVRKHGGIPPYAETRTYVTTVLDRYRQLGGTP